MAFTLTQNGGLCSFFSYAPIQRSIKFKRLKFYSLIRLHKKPTFMKNSIRTLIMAVGILTSSIAWSQMSTPPGGGNQKSEVTQYMGLVKVTIVYNSPDVAGRNPIYNTPIAHYGLVSFNNFRSTDANPSPWRAGANENTTITFSNDVEVEGKPLKAGTYGLHMILGASDVTVIFSNNSTSWGSFFYTPTEDALRVTVKSAPCEFNEFLTYEFTDRLQNSATARLKWEKLAVPFKISVPNGNDLYVKKLREEMTSNKSFAWQNVVAATNFCANNKINLDEALVWIQSLIDRNIKYFPIYQSKGNVLTAMNKKPEADAVMTEAINLPDATVNQIVNYGRTLITQTRPKEAMVVFEVANKRFPANSTALVGMARGYSANGDAKKGLKFAQDALKIETNPQQKTTIDGLVKKLEKGESIN
jgi:tetratricopeptide (TPR) repeat protein